MPNERVRPMRVKWAIDLRDQAAAANIPFFLRRMAKNKPVPRGLQIRKFPSVNTERCPAQPGLSESEKGVHRGVWDDLWGWYENGGYENVAAYLNEVDISNFNAKAPPRKTRAWWAIVDAGGAPEDAEFADALTP